MAFVSGMELLIPSGKKAVFLMLSRQPEPGKAQAFRFMGWYNMAIWSMPVCSQKAYPDSVDEIPAQSSLARIRLAWRTGFPGHPR